MIGQSIVVASAKGGAGKTSVAVNLASIVADWGWNVLAVDLDGQANMTLDLGAADHPNNDEGRGLLSATFGDTAPVVIPVRDNLSVVPAGMATFQVSNQLTADPNPLRLLALSRALERVSGNFDLVVMDTPPTGTGRIVDAAMGAAHYLLVPTPPDPGSLNGLHITASAFSSARSALNPDLTMLGVVLFRIPIAATAIRAEARAELEGALGSAVPIYTAVIRDALRAAVDQRRFALSADGYSHAARTATPWYARTAGDEPRGDEPATYSQAASGLADDYRALAREVMYDFLAVQNLAVGAQPAGVPTA